MGVTMSRVITTIYRVLMIMGRIPFRPSSSAEKEVDRKDQEM